MIVRNLHVLYKPVRIATYNAISYFNQHIAEVDVFETLRTINRQQGLLNDKRSKTKTSYHQLGLAVDVWPILKNGTWPTQKQFASWWHWDKLGEIFKAYGFEWGGDWKNFKDLPHFQMTFDIPKSELIKIYYKSGLRAVWKHLDKTIVQTED